MILSVEELKVFDVVLTKNNIDEKYHAPFKKWLKY